MDFKENRKCTREMRERLLQLECLVRDRDARIRDLDLLLDRILICLNAYGDGRGAYSITEIVQAIVEDINRHKIPEEGEDASEERNSWRFMEKGNICRERSLS